MTLSTEVEVEVEVEKLFLLLLLLLLSSRDSRELPCSEGKGGGAALILSLIAYRSHQSSSPISILKPPGSPSLTPVMYRVMTRRSGRMRHEIPRHRLPRQLNSGSISMPRLTYYAGRCAGPLGGSVDLETRLHLLTPQKDRQLNDHRKVSVE